MNNIFIISCVISLSFGWNVTFGTHCKCSDYVYQNDCDLAAPYSCAWSGTSCTTLKCVDFIIPQDCLAATSTCAFNNATQTCGSFSSCTSLKGSNDQECALQNIQCTWSSGSNCVEFKCSQFTAANCPQECQKTTNGCQDYQCSTLTLAECAAVEATNPVCKVDGKACRSLVCSDYKEQESCIVAHASGKVIQPCFWNVTQCTDASGPQNYTATTCFPSTLGSYHWSSSSATSGSCELCTGGGGGGSYGVLLQVLFALILLLA